MAVHIDADRGIMARPRWRDLHEWLELVEGIGELRRVDGASSEEDVGAITEMLERYEDSPCVLFDRLPGFEPGYRVLSNSLGTRRRHAITLGLDPAEATHEWLLAYWRGLLRGFTPIPPVVVSGGPIQEHVQRDEVVDLTRFPSPIWHPLDGGRYIVTASLNI